MTKDAVDFDFYWALQKRENRSVISERHYLVYLVPYRQNGIDTDLITLKHYYELIMSDQDFLTEVLKDRLLVVSFTHSENFVKRALDLELVSDYVFISQNYNLVFSHFIDTAIKQDSMIVILLEDLDNSEIDGIKTIVDCYDVVKIKETITQHDLLLIIRQVNLQQHVLTHMTLIVQKDP